MRDWRMRKGGPVYAKFGKAVRYRISELETFAEAASVRRNATRPLVQRRTAEAYPQMGGMAPTRVCA